ncbi:MAG: linear amide C-N hydrolase [Desulfobacteraceae bacterium]|nr:linear amide C-N hydrolase [Desulfobacteraceae bacterium]
MKQLLAIAWGAVLIACFMAGDAACCTSFGFTDGEHLIFAKNYDWEVDDGLVVVNKRGLRKTALGPADNIPLQWVSRYGSITFNQYGRDIPSGGMNENGLVIEVLWLNETRYPEPDSRKGLGTQEWIQYQLDNSADIGEVMATDQYLRIRTRGPRVHYFIADKNGDCASVEFLDGHMEVHTGETLRFKVLANHTYEKSLAYAASRKPFGGSGNTSSGPDSLSRYTRAALMLKDYGKTYSGSPVTNAFDMLTRVAQGDYTKWQIVYDIRNQAIHFKTAGNQSVRTVEFSSFDFSCASPVKTLDINAMLAGNVSNRFSVYSTTANRRLIQTAYQKTEFLTKIADDVIDRISTHPDTATCDPVK